MKNAFAIFLIALVWHLLTWKADLGLNLLLFTGLITAAARWLKPAVFARAEVRWLLGTWCLTAALVVLHHSDLSIAVFWLVGFVTIGYLQSEQVRFWVFGLVESVIGLFAGWLTGLMHLTAQQAGLSALRPALKRMGLWVIPVLVVFVFYNLYSGANAALSRFNDWFGEQWQAFFTWEIDAARAWVFLLGWVGVLALLSTRKGVTAMHRVAAQWAFPLLRRRRRSLLSSNMLGLKREHQTALFTLLSLNALLLVINALDVVFVWFDNQPKTAAELSQYVHEGTWLLILSIVLAMGVVLFFFRDKLNFFPQVQPLRRWAYIWLAQNTFLALSVGVRNGRYIQDYGLAHGRVVVLIFLLLVAYGLYTMYVKVSRPNTVFYLLQANARAMLVILVLAAAVNWDALITHYNLRRPNPDTYYLTSELTNNLVPLAQYKATGQIPKDLATEIQMQIDWHRDHWQTLDWRSWTWSGYRQAQL